MKLSEALRKGLKVMEENGIAQTTAVMFDVDDYGNVCGVCALGAAYLGTFGIPDDVSGTYGYGELNDAFNTEQDIPQCLQKLVSEKAKERQISTIETFILHENDAAGLSIEEIANKLEQCNL